MPRLAISYTTRCLAYAEFTDANGMSCNVMKSSAAAQDMLWLGREDGETSKRMLLTRPMVAHLLPILTRFVRTGKLEPRKRKLAKKT